MEIIGHSSGWVIATKMGMAQIKIITKNLSSTPSQRSREIVSAEITLLVLRYVVITDAIGNNVVVPHAPRTGIFLSSVRSNDRFVALFKLVGQGRIVST